MSELYEELVNLETERDYLRQRVKELEGDHVVTMNRCECGRGKRPSYDKCLVCAYQERGERMKMMRYSNNSFMDWFDEKGEPL